MATAPAPALAWLAWAPEPVRLDRRYGNEPAIDSTMDLAGNVVVASVYGNVAGSYDHHLVVEKLSPLAGLPLWTNAGPVSSGVTACLVATDADGNVLVALDQSSGGTMSLRKLHRDDGHVLWDTVVGTASNDDPRLAALRVDALGDVVLSAHLRNLHVIKVAGASGEELWHAVVPELYGAGPKTLLHVGPQDITAGGVTGSFVALVRLDAHTGSVRWSAELPVRYTGPWYGGDRKFVADVDAAGDVFLSAEDDHVSKYDGDSGEQLWEKRIISAVTERFRTGSLTITPAGDVVVAGVSDALLVGPMHFVTRFDGASGEQLWHNDLTCTDNTPQRNEPYRSGWDTVAALAIDAGGDFVVAGTCGIPEQDIAVFKVSADTGESLWWRFIDGEARPQSNGCDAALWAAGDAHGAVVVTGKMGTKQGGCQPVAMKLAAGDGSFTPQSVATSRMVLYDPGPPEQRRMSFRAAGREVFGVMPETIGDPTCEAPDGGGARIRLFGGGSAPLSEDIPLSCDGWTRLGTAERPAGYRYDDPALAFGPCSLVELRTKNGRGQIQIQCESTNTVPLAFDLSAAQQHGVGIRLELGGSVYCSEVDATNGTIGADSDTLFKAASGGRVESCREP